MRIAALLLVATLFSLAASAAPDAGDQIVLRDDAALGAALAGANERAAAALLDRRFTHVGADGRVTARPAFLAALAAAPAGGAATDVAVHRYGALAMVTGIRHPDAAGPGISYLHVWVQHGKGWRAFVDHESAVSTAPSPAQAAASATGGLGSVACDNPCRTVPYKPRTVDEKAIVAAYQAVESAVIADDPKAWGAHIAEEFVRYSGTPSTKAERIAFIEKQRAAKAAPPVGPVKSMHLWVFGDAAVMTAQHYWPDAPSRPPYDVTRVWVKRDGRWQMTVSQQTRLAAS